MRALSVVVAFALGLVVWVGILSRPAAAETLTPTAAPSGAAAGRPYPGNGATEPALVGAEDARLADIRTMTSAAQWRGVNTSVPYRLPTTRISLILVPRELPYTLAELAFISPASVERQPYGFLVKEHVVVLAGATLSITPGEVVRLASDGTGFSSLVTLGGTLTAQGSPNAPVVITSWNVATKAPDANTADGRGYVRVLGGRAVITDTRLEHLGYWSGRTGGLALTGQDRHPSTTTTNAPAATPSAGGTNVARLEPNPRNAEPVTAELRSVQVSGGAFGLFVSDAEGVTVRDSSMEGSLVDGLVLHRGVRTATLTNVQVTNSNKDGVVVSREATGVELLNVVTTDNGNNGLTVDGRPLALGPGVAGDAITPFGGNTVTGGVSAGNDRYGVEVLGGYGTTVSGVEVGGNAVGVVVSEGATDVTLSGNHLSGAQEQAISVRDGATKVVVRDNVVNGGGTGIYVRNAQATIGGNTVDGVREHGITVVGHADGTVVAGNTVAGRGSSALDLGRATGVLAENNLSDGWVVSKSLQATLAGSLKPLSVVWMLVLLAILLSVRVRLRARKRGIVDPFADQAPLSQITRGIVDRNSVGGDKSQTPRPVPPALSSGPEHEPARSPDSDREGQAFAQPPQVVP